MNVGNGQVRKDVSTPKKIDAEIEQEAPTRGVRHYKGEDHKNDKQDGLEKIHRN